MFNLLNSMSKQLRGNIYLRFFVWGVTFWVGEDEAYVFTEFHRVLVDHSYKLLSDCVQVHRGVYDGTIILQRKDNKERWLEQASGKVWTNYELTQHRTHSAIVKVLLRRLPKSNNNNNNEVLYSARIYQTRYSRRWVYTNVQKDYCSDEFWDPIS